MYLLSFNQFLNEGFRELASAMEHNENASNHVNDSKPYHRSKALYHLNMAKHHQMLSKVHLENGSVDGGIKHQNIYNAHSKRYEHHKAKYTNWSDELAGNV